MKKSSTFVTVTVAHSLECRSKAVKILSEPTERRKATPNLGGFFVLRLSALKSLWVAPSSQTSNTHWLVQVNSVLDESKPRGQKLFFMGDFFFCLPFVIKLINFSLFFLLVITPYGYE